MSVRIGAAPSEPVEIELPRGVTVRVDIVAPEADMAGMRAYATAWQETKDEARALLAHTVAIGQRVIRGWSGVLDRDGREVEPDADSVRALFLGVPDIAASFRVQYADARALWSAEGNGCGSGSCGS